MSVKLRLVRMGRKKLPFYRIVAVDSRTRRDGKYIEKIGVYDPLQNPAKVELDKELVFKWLGNGATPSDTVNSLLRREGILMEWDFRKRGLSDDQIQEELKKRQVTLDERRKKEEAVAAMEKRQAEKDEREKKTAEAKAAAEAEAKAAEEAAAEEASAEEASAEEAPTKEAADEGTAE